MVSLDQIALVSTSLCRHFEVPIITIIIVWRCNGYVTTIKLEYHYDMDPE